MKLWIEAQLSPAVAAWINRNFPDIEACSVSSLNLTRAKDSEIFDKARTAGAVIMSKDADFVRLVRQKGMPPQIIWITVGNSSHKNLCAILRTALPKAKTLLEKGEPVVEISQ